MAVLKILELVGTSNNRLKEYQVQVRIGFRVEGSASPASRKNA
jgi:flavin-binding protein dodecin